MLRAYGAPKKQPNREQGPANGSCQVRLLHELSKSRCTLGESFGCSKQTGIMFVRDRCSGHFACNDVLVSCESRSKQKVRCACARQNITTNALMMTSELLLEEMSANESLACKMKAPLLSSSANASATSTGPNRTLGFESPASSDVAIVTTWDGARDYACAVLPWCKHAQKLSDLLVQGVGVRSAQMLMLVTK